MSKFIAIDIGSSFVKAALFDLDSHTLIAKEKRMSPQKKISDDVNRFEIDAYRYVDLVRSLLTQITAEHKGITGLLLSTQMHGVVFKPRDMDPVYISWQDQRCIEQNGEHSYLEALKNKISICDMSRHGVYLKPMMGLCNLHTAIRQHQFECDGELFSLGSFISNELCGANICHPHNAAPMGLINVDDNTVDEALLEKMELSGLKLPRIAKKDNEILGEIKLNGNLIYIYPDFGDMQIAALGSRISRGDALVNIATASQVMAVTDKVITGTFETRPFFGGLFLRTISQLPSGRNLKVLIDFIRSVISDFSDASLSDDEIWDKVHLLLSRAKHIDSNLAVNPYFYASGEHLSGGAINFITPSNLSCTSIFEAMFSAMAKSYREHLEKLGNYDVITRIVCAGGVSFKVPELIHKIRKFTQKKCELPLMQDEAIYGMFIAAMFCSEKISSVYDSDALTLNIKG